MTVLRVQVELDSTTGLPEDAAMNVWHFRSVSAPMSGDIAGIKAALTNFYNDIAVIYSENTLTGDARTKMWDLLDGVPRVPVDEDGFTITGMGVGDALPTECSITMSFQGLPESGVNQRRKRGRLFLGPLDQGTSSTAAGVVKITTISLETIAAAATVMIGAGLSATWQWVVFSPTLAGTLPWSLGTLNAAAADVDNGWIDNAFDTQRRRGTEADARETFG